MTAPPVDVHPDVPQTTALLPLVPVPDPKIYLRHRSRRALIYVRQSHPNQVRHHPESASIRSLPT